MRWIATLLDRLFGALSTALLLAVVVTLPVLQFFALGYMLNAAGRLARTGRVSDAFPGVAEASRIGQTLLAGWILTLPGRFALSLQRDAELIAPTSRQAQRLVRTGEVLLLVASVMIILGVLAGGRLGGFFRPIKSLRALIADAKRGEYLRRNIDRTRAFFGSFGAAKVFTLGVRGYLGAALWLVLPTTLVALGKRGPLALMGALWLLAVALYLPFLQIHFAAHDEWRRIFAVRTVRYLFKRAPLAFAGALVGTLLFALPLYLLKIELVPRDALWLPAVVFLATIFPMKLLAAWAYHRAARRERPRHLVWQWLGRLVMLPAAGLYVLAVFLTQFTGWHGVFGLYEQHAFLLPVPF